MELVSQYGAEVEVITLSLQFRISLSPVSSERVMAGFVKSWNKSFFFFLILGGLLKSF